MKTRIHLSVGEYEFVEIEEEVESVEEANELYNASKTLKMASTEGLDHKEWRSALDRYLTDGTGETDVYLRMSDSQKGVFQELKKSFKRIKAKEE